MWVTCFFGVSRKKHISGDDVFEKCFTTIDATDYDVITSVNHNRFVFNLGIDAYDTMLAVVENNFSDSVLHADSVVRVWEIGGTRAYDDDGGDSEEQDKEEDESFTFDDEDDESIDHISTDDEEDDDEDEDFDIDIENDEEILLPDQDDTSNTE
eukprot:TRINITY_DN4588_c0_g1_i1.p2 TRINITY_DN4588_c0_g1~~TRINITY_DN4588_c0_g1_i1.p2  ORF type:complete len:154 (+),score=41.97 TRINITY_DN4588_c0_g1_i1:426-887(+)